MATPAKTELDAASELIEITDDSYPPNEQFQDAQDNQDQEPVEFWFGPHDTMDHIPIFKPDGGDIPKPDGGDIPKPDGGDIPEPDDGGDIPKPDGGAIPKPFDGDIPDMMDDGDIPDMMDDGDIPEPVPKSPETVASEPEENQPDSEENQPEESQFEENQPEENHPPVAPARRAARPRIDEAGLTQFERAQLEKKRASSRAWHQKWESKGVPKKARTEMTQHAGSPDQPQLPGNSPPEQPDQPDQPAGQSEPLRAINFGSLEEARTYFVRDWISNSSMPQSVERRNLALRAWMASPLRAEMMASRTGTQT